MIIAAFVIHGDDPFKKMEMALLFLIAYMSHRDFSAALTITIIFVVTLNLILQTDKDKLNYNARSIY